MLCFPSANKLSVIAHGLGGAVQKSDITKEKHKFSI